MAYFSSGALRADTSWLTSLADPVAIPMGAGRPERLEENGYDDPLTATGRWSTLIGEAMTETSRPRPPLQRSDRFRDAYDHGRTVRVVVDADGADLVVLAPDLTVVQTYIGGRLAWPLSR